MGGEQIATARITRAGMEHDRLYAFESDDAPPGMLRLSGAQRREMLRFRSEVSLAGTEVTTPRGTRYAVDDPALLGQLPAASGLRLTRAETPQTDVRPLHLLSLATVRQLEQELGHALDARHFRANLLLGDCEAFSEDAWVGQEVAVGEATLRILERTPRCRFSTLDPETAEPLPELMRLLHELHQGRSGVYARVLQPGLVQVGDILEAVNVCSARGEPVRAQDGSHPCT